MDIHKPKPWHGVGEFLKEYLVIVIGVLDIHSRRSAHAGRLPGAGFRGRVNGTFGSESAFP